MLVVIQQIRSRPARIVAWGIFGVVGALAVLGVLSTIGELLDSRSRVRGMIALALSWFPRGPWVWPVLLAGLLVAAIGVAAMELLRAAVRLGLIRDPATEAQVEQSVPQRQTALRETETVAAIRVPGMSDYIANRISRGEAAPSPNAPAFIIGKVMRFAVVDSMDLSKADFKDLEREFKQPRSGSRMWYVAWLQLTSLNATTRATDWQFDIQRRNGTVAIATATRKRWGRPKGWSDIPYTTLDLIENNALIIEHVYNVLVYLAIDELASNLDLETLRARFVDGSGRPTTLMLDEARDAKRIFDDVQQVASFRDKVRSFAMAIRKALIAYHGRTDADEVVDNTVHTECTARIGPLVDGLQAALGRTTLIDDIRYGQFSTVRGMAKAADDLDIAAGLMQ